MATPAPRTSNSLPGGNSEREPPDPIPNSEVKTLCADGSVPFRHARVGHCQALIRKNPRARPWGFCFLAQIAPGELLGPSWASPLRGRRCARPKSLPGFCARLRPLAHLLSHIASRTGNALRRRRREDGLSAFECSLRLELCGGARTAKGGYRTLRGFWDGGFVTLGARGGYAGVARSSQPGVAARAAEPGSRRVRGRLHAVPARHAGRRRQVPRDRRCQPCIAEQSSAIRCGAAADAARRRSSAMTAGRRRRCSRSCGRHRRASHRDGTALPQRPLHPCGDQRLPARGRQPQPLCRSPRATSPCAGGWRPSCSRSSSISIISPTTTSSPDCRIASSSRRICRARSRRRSAAAACWRCSSSISTASSTSTIPAATRPATSCSRPWRSASAAPRARTTSWCGWAATNSSWC